MFVCLLRYASSDLFNIPIVCFIKEHCLNSYEILLISTGYELKALCSLWNWKSECYPAQSNAAFSMPKRADDIQFPKAQKSGSLALCEPEEGLYQGTENIQNKSCEVWVHS